MSEAHTPGPWHAAFTAAGWQIHAGDERCTIVADVTAEADAALIVRAVNAHTALLAACEAMLLDVAAYICRGGTLTEKEGTHVDTMRNAVRKAKGEA